MEELYLAPIVLSVLVALIVIVVAFVMSKKKNLPKDVPKEKIEVKERDIKPKMPKKNPKKGNKRQLVKEHQRHICTLKNHSNEVVHAEFSPCGNYLATASEDRTLMLYKIKTLLEPSHPHKRVNILGDVPGRFCCSIDGKYIIVSLQMTNQLIIYGISSKGATELRKFDAHACHKLPVNAVDFSSNSKYLLSCSSTDTKVNLWDLKGNVIFSLVTNQMANQMARFTPNGQFVGVATISPEVKLWEIVEDKAGNFVSLEKAIHCSSTEGHSKTITSLDFTSNSKNMITGSEDSTWKTWDIDVNYKLQEDSHCTITAKEPNSHPIQYVRVSPNNKYLATISNDTTIIIWDLENGSIIDQIEGAHARKITAVSWARNSDMLVSSSEDNLVKLWDTNK